MSIQVEKPRHNCHPGSEPGYKRVAFNKTFTV